jgi:hypothetical protein
VRSFAGLPALDCGPRVLPITLDDAYSEPVSESASTPILKANQRWRFSLWRALVQERRDRSAQSSRIFRTAAAYDA